MVRRICKKMEEALEAKHYLKEFEQLPTYISAPLTVIVEELRDLHGRIDNVITMAGIIKGDNTSLEERVGDLEGDVVNLKGETSNELNQLSDDTGTALRDIVIPKLATLISTLELVEWKLAEQDKAIEDIKRQLLL